MQQTDQQLDATEMINFVLDQVFSKAKTSKERTAIMNELRIQSVQVAKWRSGFTVPKMNTMIQLATYAGLTVELAAMLKTKADEHEPN